MKLPETKIQGPGGPPKLDIRLKGDGLRFRASGLQDLGLAQGVSILGSPSIYGNYRSGLAVTDTAGCTTTCSCKV